VSLRDFRARFFRNFRFRPSFSPGSISRIKKYNFKKILPVLILGIAVIIAVFWVLGLLRRTGKPSSRLAADGRAVVAGAKATQSLNREFSFPLKNSKGVTLDEIKFLLESAQLRDEIIVKGNRATAIQGRTFLILTVKITSSFTRSLEINSKDYFRLTVNDNSIERLAPEIHNDPVIVQPTSTKYTRLGFPINDSDKNLKLLVGEIEGEKTTIDLNWQ